ncbi:hypothetical protein EDD86DRAFT_204631 [Gorgonomyces haynaldii]|nr:hypothetical protein EDD86DRAFT_204631 [Gorgonomyces haynaldii]
MSWTLPPHLLQNIAQYCDFQTNSRLSQCSKVVYGLLEANCTYFTPCRLIQLVDDRESQKVERLMKTALFQSKAVENSLWPLDCNHIGFCTFLLARALRRGLVTVAASLLTDSRVQSFQYDEQYYEMAMEDQDPDIGYELYRLLERGSVYAEMGGLLSFAIQFKHQRVLDHLLRYEIKRDDRIAGIQSAIKHGDSYALSRLVSLPQFEASDVDGAFEDMICPKTVAILEQAIQGRDNINFYDMLCLAITENNLEVARYLSKRVDLNQGSHCALLLACMHDHFDLVRQMLSNPAVDYPHRDELLNQSDFEIFRVFFSDPKVIEANRWRIASSYGSYCVSSVDVVNYLLSKGEDVNNLLDSALAHGSIQVVQHLLSLDGLDFKEWTRSWLFNAAERGDCEIFQCLLNDARFDYTRSGTMAASDVYYFKKPALARVLLKHPFFQISNVDHLSDWQLEFRATLLVDEVGISR